MMAGAHRFLAILGVTILLCASCATGNRAHRSSIIGPAGLPGEIEAQLCDTTSGQIFPVKMRPQHSVADGEKIALAAPSQLLPKLPPSRGARQIQQVEAADGDDDSLASIDVQGNQAPSNNGGDYDEDLPHEHVVALGTTGLYRPRSGAPAYATYRFPLSGYEGAPTMKFEWEQAPSDYSHLWVAFANLEKNTWEWYQGPDDLVLTIPDYGPYTDAESGWCFFVVLLGGTEEATLARLSVGGSEMRATGVVYLVEQRPALTVELSDGGRSLPDSVDLSSQCAPVNDQKSWAACTAFAVGDGAYNYELNRIYSPYGWDLTNPFNRVSPKYLYIVSGELQGWPAGPSYFRYTGQVVSDLVDHGVATELNAPYDLIYSSSWSSMALADAQLLTIDRWDVVPCRSEGELRSMKIILANQRTPIIMQTRLDGGFFNYEAGQVWNYEGPRKSGHAMVIVGYDESRQAFKVRNSWGEYWGDDGYAWIGYETFLSGKALIDCWILEDEYDPAVAQRFLGTEALLAPPGDVEATDGEYLDRVLVTWERNDDATGYIISRDLPDNVVAEVGRDSGWFDTTLHDALAHTYWVRSTDGARISYPSASDTGFAG